MEAAAKPKFSSAGFPGTLPLRIPRSADSANIEGLNSRLSYLIGEALTDTPIQSDPNLELDYSVFDGLGRAENYTRFLTREVEVISLAEMFARRVTSAHNKNVVFTLFGDVGSGKSMTLLSIAVSAAQWISRIRGGSAYGPPEKYFNFNHVAVIDPDSLNETLNNLEDYGIYILDDAGPGFDARAFMSATNRSLGHILQTCRTFHNIILISAPYAAMIDITAHRIAQYYAEIAEAHHEAGLTFVKVFNIVRAYRDKKTYYVYPTRGRGVVIKRYAAELPPGDLKREYDKVRDAKAAEIQSRRNEGDDGDGSNGGRRGKGCRRGEDDPSESTRARPRGDRQARIQYVIENGKEVARNLASQGLKKNVFAAQLSKWARRQDVDFTCDFTSGDVTTIIEQLGLKGCHPTSKKGTPSLRPEGGTRAKKGSPSKKGDREGTQKKRRSHHRSGGDPPKKTPTSSHPNPLHSRDPLVRPRRNDSKAQPGVQPPAGTSTKPVER